MNFDERDLVLPRAVLVFVCILPMACSRSSPGVEVYPVRGEVFFNGQPAAGAWIHFHPVEKDDCSAAFAVVEEDGSFQLSTFGTNDGAEPGDYVVTLNWRDEERDEGETLYGPDRFGERYSKPDKSTLKATIGAGENEIPRFDLME